MNFKFDSQPFDLLLKILISLELIAIYTFFSMTFQIEAPVYANLVSSFEYLEILNRKILNYGWVNFPLAYTQVATLSVYAYLISSLFACQFLHPSDEETWGRFPVTNVTFATSTPFDNHSPDIYIPW